MGRFTWQKAGWHKVSPPTTYWIFVVDFYASRFRLVVEVDGPIHDQQMEADKARQEILKVLGLTVLRNKTETVEKSLPLALVIIRGKIQELKQNAEVPSPHVGEG
jgi:very-short-patch-repair endonuclease